MGWSFEYSAKHYKPNGSVDRKKCLDDLFTWECESKDTEGYVGCRILKSAMVGREYYGACEKYHVKDGKEERDYVVAVICLTCGKGRDGTQWGYKDMSEDCGPYYYKCPNSILELLTSARSECASEWREKCREYNKQKKEKAKNPVDVSFVPPGVSVIRRRGNVLIYNENVRKSGYTWIRYTKWTLENAMISFLKEYGTSEQRRFFADCGKDCPESWKEGVA